MVAFIGKVDTEVSIYENIRYHIFVPVTQNSQDTSATKCVNSLALSSKYVYLGSQAIISTAIWFLQSANPTLVGA